MTSIVEAILSRVGSRMTFNYHGNEDTTTGVLKERAVIGSGSNAAGIPAALGPFGPASCRASLIVTRST